MLPINGQTRSVPPTVAAVPARSSHSCPDCGKVHDVADKGRSEQPSHTPVKGQITLSELLENSLEELLDLYTEEARQIDLPTEAVSDSPLRDMWVRLQEQGNRMYPINPSA